MALLFFDGCDHYDSSSTGMITKKWDNIITYFNNIEHRASEGRFGGGCIVLRNQYQTVTKHITPSTTVIAGAAFKPGGEGFWLYPSALIEIAGIDGSILFSLITTVTGVLQLLQQGEVIGQSSVPFRNGIYQYIELKAVIDASNAEAWVHQGEDETIHCSACSLGTGINQAAEVLFGRHQGWVREECYFYLDDLYICNGVGSYCNDFLGDVRMDEKLPTADGYYNEWTATGGGAHYTQVDDPWNQIDTTTLVSSRTVGARDTYLYDDLHPTEATVHAVGMTYYATKHDSGQRKLKALGRLSGSDVEGSEVNIGEGYGFYQSMIYQKPGGGAWTVGDVNNGEFGQKISS